MNILKMKNRKKVQNAEKKDKIKQIKWKRKGSPRRIKIYIR